ncbi:MAG: ATP-binding protein [Candidatus Sericytochromatia bacterium]|nr:ATP-binding protein [Candidatus Sericytochromatia bacterium]
MQRKKLPIGIQTFREIRENGHYYVDKTPFVLRLIEQGKLYFLSRPRRFGKSLLLDTMKELFEGNRALFAGLHAEQHWDWALKHPVVGLSFSDRVLQTREDLAASLHVQLTCLEEQHGVTPRFSDPAGRLRDLIQTLHTRSGQRVVVLVDEYDKPILDNLTEPRSRPSLASAGSAPPWASPDRARLMRDGLRDLYSVLKGADAHLRFVFITGVSKFSKVSLFSGLNNLRDITLSPEYSAICGYTEQDVDTVFTPELEGLDRERVRRWYNGYNWTGEAVYNPFDLLLLFQERQFKPYWFETGPPTFLVDHLAKHRFFTPDLARLTSSAELLGAFDVDRIEPEALLWQAGYLTIRDAREVSEGLWVYTLGYPNREVEASLNGSLIYAYGGQEAPAFRARTRLVEAMQSGDTASLRDIVHALFASIPHDWHRNNPLAQYEGFYASVFYSHLAALGLDTRVEDATNKGRIDLATRLGDRVYLFEFKVVEQVPEGRALAQLQARGYSEKYREPGVTVTLVGIEFSREERNVVGFEVAQA